MTCASPNTVDLPSCLRALSDHDLVFQGLLIARGERRATIHLLHHLNEVERRKLYLDLGYPSLFAYCVRKLNYSTSAAGRRIQAARCIRRHPRVLDLLHTGQLDLSAVSLIEPVLSEENQELILDRVRGKSYREVDRVVSEYRPPMVFRDRIRAVRVALPSPASIDAVLFERDCARRGPYPRTPGEGSWVVSAQKMFVQFLASEELMAKYEEAKALLSRSRPDATFAEVLEVLLGEFIERHSPEARQRRREARKAAAAPSMADGGKFSTAGAGGDCKHSRRREWNGSRRTRHILAEVRDAVFIRDGGRCTYVAPGGTRCESTHALEIDHIRPFAAGGTHDSSNLRLLCPAHNRLAAEQTLGRHVMAGYWRRE